MGYTDFQKDILKIMSEESGIEIYQLSGETKIADMGLDSLDHTNLIWRMEDQFEIEFDQEIMEKVTVISDLFNLIENNKLPPEKVKSNVEKETPWVIAKSL
jgi:acyl carrier protein